MATLTGFKAVSSETPSGQQQQEGQQPQQNGQHNPVFVFDEVDVSSTNNDNNEEFLDASSNSSVLDAKNQHQQNAKQKVSQQQATKQPISQDEQASVAIEISANDQEECNVPAEQQKQQKPKTPPASIKKQQQQQPTKQVVSATGQQMINKQRQPMSSLAAPGDESTNPNGCDGDNVSVNMLAVDCTTTGKSPRTPRRSPLMALFRGKPRESVRRSYTDEDQFEIEWANLSLEVQKKWYQKFNWQLLLHNSWRCRDPDDDKPGWANEQGSVAKSAASQHQAKRILNNVDGRIKSGEITAVLGPSGAGKTSLLNSLFGKYRTAVEGSIKVTGAPSRKHLTVCTIPQSDFLIGYLTTEESLWFASRLKNCEDDFNHDRNIERVIELLGLQRCRHTRINKLSGGQYKRVSIAQEMLSSPDILVLDEPTSGLDSLTCYRTVKVLRDLVEASKTHNLANPMSIILTIHQPHREVLDLFHSVYVMAVGGQTLYQGPPNEMEEVINKFSGVQMPAEGYNPASFMVELASEEYGRKPIEVLVSRQRSRFASTTQHQYPYDFTKTDQSSLAIGSSDYLQASGKAKGTKKKTDSAITLYPLDDGKYVEVDLQGDSSGGNAQNTKKELQSSSKDIDSRIMTPRSGKNSDGVFWRHVNLMSKRCFLSNTRDPLLFTMRVGAHIFIPLVVALIYGPYMGVPNGCPFYKPEINLLEYASMGLEEIQEKHDDIRIQFQNVGLHFMVYYAFGLCMLGFTAISFPMIMHVLIKEIRNGWYSLSTFIMGKMFAELPMAFILPPISVGIIYLMTGQPSSYLQWRYFVQSIILILIVMIAEAKGLVFGALCMNSMQTAVFAASVSTVPFILLSGFLIRIREVPYVLQHFARFSYFKHSVEALIITRYGYGMCPCDPALIPAGGTPRIIGIPPQIMSLTDYYVNSYVAPGSENSTELPDLTTTETNIVGNNRNISRIINSITTLSPEVDEIDPTSESGANVRRARQVSRQTQKSTTTSTTTVATTTTEADEDSSDDQPVKQGLFFDKLASLLTRANAFGYSITSCADVEPFTMKDMQLKDSQLPNLIGYLFFYIVVLKFLSYLIVEICVKLKL